MRPTLVLTLILSGPTAIAQLPNGSTAPDFTLTDLNGTPHTLSSYLDAGRTVFLEIFAAHCPTCWGYHQTHRLKDLYEQYGPDGTNELMVLALEYDQWNGMTELMGIGDPWVTAGDWLTGTPYPIFNVEDPDRGVFTDYNVTFYPAIYRICPDRIVQQVFTSHTEAQLLQMLQDCQSVLNVGEEEDLGDVWFDTRSRALMLARPAQVRQVEVIDLHGRVVLNVSGPMGHRVGLGELSAGVWLVRIVTASGSHVRRFYME